MDDTTISADDGLSRRELLKRAATVGAAAWTIPIVTTFNAPAFAQAVVSPATCEKFECGDAVVQCGSGPGGSLCACTEDVEGNPFCANDASCVFLPPCSSSATCPDGWRCIADTCCSTAVCAPPCGVAVAEDHGTGTALPGRTAFGR